MIIKKLMSYIFRTPKAQPVFGPLPEGDYNFIVSEADEPHLSPAGNLVLPLKLAIQPGGEPVFANPWARTEESITQDGRDDIARFLVCVNRAPKDGEEPDWKGLPGAKGRCRLSTEIAQQGALAGKEVNKVHYFHAPKEAEPKQAIRAPVTGSKSDFEALRKKHAPPVQADDDQIPY